MDEIYTKLFKTFVTESETRRHEQLSGKLLKRILLKRILYLTSYYSPKLLPFIVFPRGVSIG
ncbi:MAG: hypothetical protein NWE91_05865 [Candidatus Bathyarchaeota archaeon]|nr:hypothetical protein [Candidatus Bathyarchaeota archaeon]